MMAPIPKLLAEIYKVPEKKVQVLWEEFESMYSDPKERVDKLKLVLEAKPKPKQEAKLVPYQSVYSEGGAVSKPLFQEGWQFKVEPKDEDGLKDKWLQSYIRKFVDLKKARDYFQKTLRTLKRKHVGAPSTGTLEMIDINNKMIMQQDF